MNGSFLLNSHGAWLTMGNVDLHLIKGRPAVHADDDLVTAHEHLIGPIRSIP